MSLAVPGTFLYFLFFGRIYALTGAFIVMIFEMITGDIATFGVIYVIVVTSFGQGTEKQAKNFVLLKIYDSEIISIYRCLYFITF